jgi:hypothetical protein
MVAKKKTSSESRPLANRKSNPETHNMMVWQLGGDNSTTKSTLLHEVSIGQHLIANYIYSVIYREWSVQQ